MAFRLSILSFEFEIFKTVFGGGRVSEKSVCFLMKKFWGPFFIRNPLKKFAPKNFGSFPYENFSRSTFHKKTFETQNFFREAHNFF